MPKKSVREMTRLERMRHSLSSRVFRAVLFGSILLGVICLLIGLGLYTVAVAKQDISTAFNLSQNASAILGKTVDTEDVSREVMTRYRSLSDREREDPYSEDYAARFADIYDRDDYKMISAVLSDFKNSSDVYDIYLAMYVRDPARSGALTDGTCAWETYTCKNGCGDFYLIPTYIVRYTDGSTMTKKVIIIRKI